MGEPGLEQRVARLEGRVEDFAGRFDALSTQFRWLVAGQVTVLVTVVGVLATALFAV